VRKHKRCRRPLLGLVFIIVEVFALVSAGAQVTKNSVVFVKIIDPSGQQKNQGSGVLLTEDGWILTAHHLFEEIGFDRETYVIQVSFLSPNHLVPAKFFGCDPFGADFCLLLTDNPNDIPPSAYSDPKPRCQLLNSGEPQVTVSGYPGGLSAVQWGPANVESDVLLPQFKTDTNANILPGMSGGPVIDSKGRLVGIIYGGASNPAPSPGQPAQLLSVFTPIIFGRDLLNAVGVSCDRGQRDEDEILWLTEGGVVAEWSGSDIASSSGAEPKYVVSTHETCNAALMGAVAVCWENKPSGYPNVQITDFFSVDHPAAWCTYKSPNVDRSTIQPSRPGATSGVVYYCGKIVRRHEK
jgi:hypothetical protein